MKQQFLGDGSALCRHCHTCGTPLKQVLDGEEWCTKCKEYRRYRTHGWTHALADKTECPSTYVRSMLRSAEMETCPKCHSPRPIDAVICAHCE